MAPRFFVPSIDPSIDRVTLPNDEAHHLRHVLRLRGGDPVVLFDGQGREWSAEVEHAEKSVVIVRLLGERTPAPEPRVNVTVAMAVLKADHMDDVVRDVTMLGAAAIVPITTARVIAPNRTRSHDVVQRWERVAVASAKQCGRAVVPVVQPVTSFDA